MLNCEFASSNVVICTWESLSKTNYTWMIISVNSHDWPFGRGTTLLRGVTDHGY